MEVKQWNKSNWFASSFNRSNWIAPMEEAPIVPPKTGGSGAWKRAIVIQKKRDSNREIEELIACGAV